jgi:hypothetical protein
VALPPHALREEEGERGHREGTLHPERREDAGGPERVQDVGQPGRQQAGAAGAEAPEQRDESGEASRIERRSHAGPRDGQLGGAARERPSEGDVHRHVGSRGDRHGQHRQQADEGQEPGDALGRVDTGAVGARR